MKSSAINHALFGIAFTAALLVIGCAQASERLPVEASTGSETPRYSLTMVLGSDSRDEFFEAIRAFSESHAFAYRIARLDPNGEHYLIQLWREDVKLVIDNPFNAREFKLDIYNTCSCEPALPESELHALAAELRHAISTVESAKTVD